MSRFAIRAARTTTLSLLTALALSACEDVTAPTDSPPSPTAIAQLPADSAQSGTSGVPGPSFATIRSTSGQSGEVRTPYPSVNCWGPAGGFQVHVAGATVYPAQVMSSGERVRQQVYLYKWTGSSWANVASRSATRSVGPVTMPTSSFTGLQSQGYYKVVTRFTWKLYTTSGWTNIGTKIVDYNQSTDYKGSYGATSSAGYCTL